MTRRRTARPAHVASGHTTWLAGPAGAALVPSCSLSVLISLGTLAGLAPSGASAAVPGVPLPAGTLPVLRGVVSGQAVVQAPTATATGARLTVAQQSQRAVIDWKSFDVARGSEVRFEQPNSQASTLNRIHDATPSVVQGQITANGQVILINQNGILFDRGSQVNTQLLAVSTLNLSNSRFEAGLSAGGRNTPAFEGGYDEQGVTLPARPDGSRPAAIEIGKHGDPAAPAPRISAASGGAVIMVAPRVDNLSGVITAPDGQVILAAGNKAYLALPEDSETVLRGLRVEIDAEAGADVNLSSLVRNAGGLSADRGNVTLAGLAINQAGRVSATTAVQSNGSVFLQARSSDGRRGSVAFAAGSVTETAPDRNDTGFLPESQSYKGATAAEDRRALIEVQGRTITSEGQVSAPGGRITLSASDSSDPAAARIYLGDGSVTSVAGAWSDQSADRNLVSFRVTSNELKDSPNQRNGVLRGAQVTVDLRKGSPLLDTSGYLAAQKRSVVEKAAEGGDLLLDSGGAVIQRAGATLDASGGGYRYAAGAVATTKLLGEDGRIYDISNAPENRRYTTLLDSFERVDARWGQRQTFDKLLYGYGQQDGATIEGKAGGTITLRASAGVVLDGALTGGATAGAGQLAAAPRGATLTIGALNERRDGPADDQRIGNIVFTQRAGDTLGADFKADTPLSVAQADEFFLAANQLFGASYGLPGGALQQTGFEAVELTSNGRISLPASVAVTGPAGASLTLRAPQVDIAGSVSLPGGTISATALGATNLVSGETDARLELASTARLSTAGAWINTSSVDGSPVGPVTAGGKRSADGSTVRSTTAGGTIDLSVGLETASTRLAQGAVLDVSGGAGFDRNGRLTAGSGGRLTVQQGNTPQSVDDWLQADLRGFGVSQGGSLVVRAPQLVVAQAGTVVDPGTTRIDPGLFSDAGFASVQLSSVGALAVAPGTAVYARQLNRVVDVERAKGLPSGGDLASVSQVQLLRDDQRRPVSVTLRAGEGPLSGNGRLEVAEGARIATEPRGAITVSAVDGLFIDGALDAPGGSITARLVQTALRERTGSLEIGEHARLSAAGTVIVKPSDLGLNTATVVPGGSITLDARDTGVVVAAGAVLDVSGASRPLDTLTTPPGAAITTARVDADAGSLLVHAEGATRIEGSLFGRAPSAQGAGGAFALELALPEGVAPVVAERRIVVAQAADGLGTPGGDAAGVEAALDIDRLKLGGFDKLRLRSDQVIAFNGDVDLALARGVKLDAPKLDFARAGTVTVSAAAVALGQSQAPKGFSASEDAYRLAQDPASPVLPLTDGTARFEVSAGVLDLFGDLALDAVAQTRLASAGDIRLSGRATSLNAQPVQQRGSLATLGDLRLQAEQVYPTTRSDFTIAVADPATGTAVAGGRIDVVGAGAGASLAPVLSAGGSLQLQADEIVQGGVLRAPLGRLALEAGSALTLAEGSLTSVSAQGLTIPYGSTDAGVEWNYAYGPGLPLATLNAPVGAGKQLALSGRAIDVQSGARVDLSGGGDVQAVEFVPGSGGSNNVLLKADTFAILPAAFDAAAPVDAAIAAANLAAGREAGGFASANYDRNVYDSLEIGPGAALPAGRYTLWPAQYALLPGAYLVQLQTGSAFSALQPGQAVQLPNRQTVVAGHRSVAGTGQRESQSVGVLVRPGLAAAREASDYNISSGNAFFAALADGARRAAPPLPIDAGRVAIAGAEQLALNGEFITAPGETQRSTGVVSGRIAELDISGNRIAVVDAAGDASLGAGVLQLEAAGLNRFGGSVLLGGVRTVTDQGLRIDTGASEVRIANSSASPLALPEILLAARDEIQVAAGASMRTVVGSGQAVANGPTLRAEANGALLRLADGAQAVVERGTEPGSGTGNIVIEAGATLRAGRSMLVDASGTMRSRGRLLVGADDGSGGSLSLASARVSLGETGRLDAVAAAQADQGLVLSNEELLRYGALDALSLRGYGGIDLFGSTTLGSAGLGRLTLDTAALRARRVDPTDAPATSRLAAREIVLRNSASSGLAAADAGDAALRLDTARLVIGSGDKAIDGHASVTMASTGEIVAEGAGGTRVAGDWALSAARVTAAGGARQTWRALGTSADGSPAAGALSVTAGAATATLPESDGLGGRLRLEGRRVDVAAPVVARSGRIELVAAGGAADDGVTVSAGGRVDVTGSVKDFNGSAASSDAGTVLLQAAGGRVAVAAGARVDVSAASRGGDAGELRILARAVQLDGDLAGSASAGADSGRFALDVGRLDDIGTLGTRLAAGGFEASRSLRVREGDIRLGSGEVWRAREVVLSADAGGIRIGGRIDASGTAGGGSIRLWADSGLALEAGSRLEVAGSSTATGRQAVASNGGEVLLSTRGGTLAMDRDATVDIRSGGAGSAGRLRFVVARDDADQVGSVDLQGTVLSRRQEGSVAGEVVLEAQHVVTVNGNPTAASITALANQHAAFVEGSTAKALLDGLRGDDGRTIAASAPDSLHLRGATEVQSAGDLRLAVPWNLTTAAWLAGGEPGTLSLRAAGDLTLTGSLGLPDDNLPAAASWNLRLVAGADLGAADPLATRDADGAVPERGSVLLSGANARVRTGTGRIEVAAARDVTLDHPAAVITTSGRIGEADTEANGGNRWARDGGDIVVRAGRQVSGRSTQLVTDWLRRPNISRTQFEADPLAEWWVYRPFFAQGLGTLGGGDIRVTAGERIDGLATMLPTTARSVVQDDGSRRIEVYGGGDLRMTAGDTIDGAEMLLGRGQAQVHAGGSVGANVPVQLWVMGQGSAGAPDEASLRLQAGGTVSVQNVANPTAVFIGRPAQRPNAPSFTGLSTQYTTFLSYSANSSLALSSLSGDVSLIGSASDRITSFGNALPQGRLGDTAILPASLSLVAFDGSIGQPQAQRLLTAPSAAGTVRVLASDSVETLDLAVADRIGARGATVAQPFLNVQNSPNLTVAALQASQGAAIVDRPQPVGFVYEVQALTGSLSDANLQFPAVSRVRAGEDISNVNLTLQNLAATDVSQVRADTGDLRGFVSSRGIEVRGPGRLLLQAGRNIDLGAALITSQTGGLLATGNSANASLPDAASARLTLVAGVQGDLDLAALEKAYAELTEAGKLQDKARGDKAITAVFAKNTLGSGSISSFLTSIQTQGGSGIDLWAPAGDITVGLTTPAAGRTIGVLTNTGGAIRSVLSGDFDINQGKLLTAQGGDILVYTQGGSIDAGRGAKTSISTPPPRRSPVFQVDSAGNRVLDETGQPIVVGFVYSVPTSAAGSGIQTLTSDPDGLGPRTAPAPGSIFLFAPSGTVDAGEAGIVSGADIVIAAQTVLNAANISAAGASAGVPVVEAGSLASSLASSGATNTSGGSKAAEDAANAASSSAKASAAEARLKPTILTVEVLGFGDRNCKETDKDCFAR